jgi:hypothetical protein
MNPVNLFPKTLSRILTGPVIDFIEEVEGDADMSKAFFEAQEKAQEKAKQDKKNCGEQENSEPHFAREFFCPENYESARPPSSEPTHFVPELEIKRGFGLAEHRSSESYGLGDNPSESVKSYHLRGKVASLVQRYDNIEIKEGSSSNIGKIAQKIVENTEKLKVKHAKAFEETDILRIDAKEESKIITSQKPSQKNLKKNVSNHSGHNLETIEEDSQEEDLPQIANMEISEYMVFEKNNTDINQESLNTTPQRTKFNAVIDNNFTEISADIVFESDIHSNKEPLKVNPKDRPQNEIANEETRGCLENFSCSRLSLKRENCTIS